MELMIVCQYLSIGRMALATRRSQGLSDTNEQCCYLATNAEVFPALFCLGPLHSYTECRSMQNPSYVRQVVAHCKRGRARPPAIEDPCTPSEYSELRPLCYDDVLIREATRI